MHEPTRGGLGAREHGITASGACGLLVDAGRYSGSHLTVYAAGSRGRGCVVWSSAGVTTLPWQQN